MCMNIFHVTYPRITLTERQARHSAKFQLEGSSARGVWSAGRGVFTIVATTPKFEGLALHLLELQLVCRRSAVQ